jgi:peptidoglycan/LPS O-acetylase OafA/YrhL
MEIKDRHFGLDVIRVFAITIVFFQHVNPITRFISFSVPSLLHNTNLPDGVDLFFVLSGFLIGRILLKTDYSKDQWILSFWKRRLLRTLPNYFLFLIINIILLALKISPGLMSHAQLYYFVFLQNFYKPVDVFFWESWSLCVEEWFYLLFPLLLLLLVKIKTNLKLVFILCISIFFIFSIFIKLYFIASVQRFELDLYIRSLAISRFDTLCFGLTLAYIELTQLAFFKKMKWLGLIIFVVYLIIGDIPQKNHWQIVQLLSSALACFGIIIFMLNFPKSNLMITQITTFFSKISYSIYLIHLPILYIFNYLTHQNYSGSPMLYFFCYVIIVISLSAINYRYFELYFLKRRN